MTSQSPAIGSHAGRPFWKLSKKNMRSPAGMLAAHAGAAGAFGAAARSVRSLAVARAAGNGAKQQANQTKR